VLFVAGHGRNPNETYYFIPQDLAGFTHGRTLKSHAIGQEQWQKWLTIIPAQKSVLIFDTCESSAAAGLARGGERARETAMDRLRFATGRSVIAAARQAAYEGYKQHGVLTYVILEALTKHEGATDEVDLMQVAAHIDLKVPELSRELTGEAQRPHFKIEGNFPIGVRRLGLLGSGTGTAIFRPRQRTSSFVASLYARAPLWTRQASACWTQVCLFAWCTFRATGPSSPAMGRNSALFPFKHWLEPSSGETLRPTAFEPIAAAHATY